MHCSAWQHQRGGGAGKHWPQAALSTTIGIRLPPTYQPRDSGGYGAPSDGPGLGRSTVTATEVITPTEAQAVVIYLEGTPVPPGGHSVSAMQVTARCTARQLGRPVTVTSGSISGKEWWGYFLTFTIAVSDSTRLDFRAIAGTPGELDEIRTALGTLHRRARE